MNKIGELLALVLDALKEYQFKTFLIGAILPSQMLEKEDRVRAKFKIKGTESIKSDLTKELGKLLGHKTRKKVDYRRPDVIINIDVAKNQVTARSRAIYLFGRYVKKVRGLNQKQERCNFCSGKGCMQCDNTGLSGFDSVEGIILKKLIDSLKCDSAKFAWVGGEDKDSLVLDKGRPFFVKVINPRTRFAKPEQVSFNDAVKAKFIKEVERLPDKPLKFRVKVKLMIECERSIDDATLERLNQLENSSVKFVGKNSREVSKNIHEFNAKASDHMLEVLMLADGGLTIKQFVNGDDIEPSISQLVGCKATCKSFDVLSVQFADQV
jgi:tRNA pseudouridine synthase 10